MHDWCARLAGELAAGGHVVMVTAIEVQGSAPCAPGAKLLVGERQVLGTIGGGNLEFLAIDQARKLIQSGRVMLRQSLPLGPLLSQCCGGRVQLLYERLGAEDAPRFKAAAAMGGYFETSLDPDCYRRVHVPGPPQSRTAGGPPSSRLARGIWIEAVSRPLPQVVIFGGGHIGKALAAVLGQAPCVLQIVDGRPEVADYFKGTLDVVVPASAGDLGCWWQPASLAVILTHSHEIDYQWTRAILLRGDFGFCGLIASATKRARFLRRLRTDGVPETAIAGLTSPIGLAGISVKDPGLVAISIAGQLLPLLSQPQSRSAGGCGGCVERPEANPAPGLDRVARFGRG